MNNRPAPVVTPRVYGKPIKQEQRSEGNGHFFPVRFFLFFLRSTAIHIGLRNHPTHCPTWTASRCLTSDLRTSSPSLERVRGRLRGPCRTLHLRATVWVSAQAKIIGLLNTTTRARSEWKWTKAARLYSTPPQVTSVPTG